MASFSIHQLPREEMLHPLHWLFDNRSHS